MRHFLLEHGSIQSGSGNFYVQHIVCNCGFRNKFLGFNHAGIFQVTLCILSSGLMLQTHIVFCFEGERTDNSTNLVIITDIYFYKYENWTEFHYKNWIEFHYNLLKF